MKKLAALSRVQSIREQYILVAGSHGRVMYWEYEGDFQSLRAKLQSAALLLVNNS